MKTDIEIAQEARMSPIIEIARSIDSMKMILNCTGNTRPKFPWGLGPNKGPAFR